MEQKTVQKFEVTKEVNGWGNMVSYKTNLGTFQVIAIYNDYYGNPRCAIQPVGYVNELVKLEGFRRNNHTGHYTSQFFDFDETMDLFLHALDRQLAKGYKLFHNL